MKRIFLTILPVLALVSVAPAQTNTGLVIRSDGALLPTNAVGVIINALGLQPWMTNTNTPLFLPPIVAPTLPVKDTGWFLKFGSVGGIRTMGTDLRIDGHVTFNSPNQVRSQLDIPANPKYAVFTLDLGDNYTDFELKGTTNNWSGGGMVWFYHSPDPQKAVIWQQIWNVRPDVYFTDSQYVKPGDANMNQRTWRKQSATQSIAAMRSNTNSVIGSVTVVIGDTGGAISPTNRSLIFSWCRMTPTGPEADASGRSIWRTARPEWVAEIPIITQ